MQKKINLVESLGGRVEFIITAMDLNVEYGIQPAHMYGV